MANVEGMPLPGGIEDYEAESALDTLTRAYEIESNPKLMAAVGETARRKQDAAEQIADKIDGGTVLKSHPDSVRDGKLNF